MIKLSEISPRAPKHFVKEEIKEQTKDLFQKIGDLQNFIHMRIRLLFQGWKINILF